MKTRIKSGTGFTLIELIATIAIAGIVMIMILPYFQSGITESHRPAQRLRDAVGLQRAMETITGAYRGLVLDKKKTNLDALAISIGLEGNSNSTFCDYTFAVVRNRFISFDAGGTELENVPGARIWKVTIMSPDNPGSQLTRLFTVIEAVP